MYVRAGICFQAEDGIRDGHVTGVQTCALPICWEMPGGIVEEGESLKNAAIRETKEESGIDVEILNFCGIFQNVKKSICNTLFLRSEERRVGKECRARWWREYEV